MSEQDNEVRLIWLKASEYVQLRREAELASLKADAAMKFADAGERNRQSASWSAKAHLLSSLADRFENSPIEERIA